MDSPFATYLMHGQQQQEQQCQDLAAEPDQRDLLSAATAFFKWRQAALKANFRRELEGILVEVAQEEEAGKAQHHHLQRTQEKLEETSQALSKATSDFRLSQMHMEQLRAQNDELFRALEAAEGASRTHAEQARAATAMHQEEVKRRQDESRQSKVEADALRDAVQAAVAQQQALLEALVQRDREVAEHSRECLLHKRNSERLQAEMERLEAIARATGERAAAAEAQAAARSETISKLYGELSGLRERYHQELSELKAARIGAAEAQRMRERLDSVQATNDSLVAARDELRASLEGVMAKLTAAEQRLKRQAAAADLRGSLLDTIAHVSRELVRGGDESLVLQATTRLSSELDLALSSNTDLAERISQAEAVTAQQQGHIRRLVEECSALGAQVREAREAREAQHRLSAELAAELQRLAAEAALGPILVLDVAGNLVPGESPPPDSAAATAAATAPATSQLEAQSTAVRVILADKGFGLGALCAAIAAAPGSITSVRAQLGECRTLAQALQVEAAEVGALLAVRPFEAEELARRLPGLQDRLSKTETCLVAVREDITLKQVHAVSLEARLLAAESATRAGASLLQGWSGLLAQVVASEDGRLEPDVRLGLREELKAREDALHRSLLDLAAAAPPLLGGDPGYAAAQVVMREASNAMMDLALTLGDRLVDAPATRSRVLATEQLLADRAGQLARFREVLAAAPGQLADMVERLTAVIPDVQAMGPAVEEMLRCIRHYLAAGREPPVDVVALQGEVLMLRGLVRTKDMHIQALEAVGTGIRTGSPSRRAQKMVPLEALHAAEAARDVLTGEKAALQSRLVDQRVRLVGARHRLVGFTAELRRACELAVVFYRWRAAAAAARAGRCHTEMVEARKEAARASTEAAEEIARLETAFEPLKAAHAAEVAELTARHTAEREAATAAHTAAAAALRSAQEEELRRRRAAALQAAERRVQVLRRMLKEKAAALKDYLAGATLYLWRFRVNRQVEARKRWRDWSTRLRLRLASSAEPNQPSYRELVEGPRVTVARRLALRHAEEAGMLAAPHALTGRQIARVMLQAWRGYSHVKRKTDKVDALTEAVPTFMENLGNRRRMERAWLALRLWTAGAATRRAHQAISDYEAAAAEAAAARLAAEAAAATAGMVTAEAEEARQRQHQALLGIDAAISARGFDSTQTGGFGSIGAEIGSGVSFGVGTGFASSGSGRHVAGAGFGGGGGAPTGGYLLMPGQSADNPNMLYELPTVEVGTQYMPNTSTLSSSGAQLAAAAGGEHGATAAVVAAARAAGLEVAAQPLTSSQHPGGAVVTAPAAGSNMALWTSLPGGRGGAMPPVAGPSQATLTGAVRRRGGGASEATGPIIATAATGKGNGTCSGELAGARGTRAPSRGRPPPPSSSSRRARAAGGVALAGQAGAGMAEGAIAGPGTATAPGAAMGPRAAGVGAGAGVGGSVSSATAAVASLAERAERLMRAVESISAGVADTAAILSPRRKVLQVEGAGAAEAEDAGLELRNSTDANVDIEGERLMSPSRPPLPHPSGGGSSPSRRLQVDGTMTVEYDAQRLGGVGLSSPPRAPLIRSSPPASPTRIQEPTAALSSSSLGPGGIFVNSSRSPPRNASPPRGGSPTGRGGGSASVTTAAATSAGFGSSPRARPRSSSRPSRPASSVAARRAGGGSRAVTHNSEKLLLDGGPVEWGRGRQLRAEPRSYGHVGSRLHEETLSTLAKKRKSGTTTNATPAAAAGPTRGLPGPTPGATPLAPGALRPLPVPPPPPALVASAWPHVPASSLPAGSPPTSSGGPHTADFMRRRSAPAEAPSVHFGPTIEITASAAAAAPGAASDKAAPVVAPAAPAAPLPVSVAPPAGKLGRVVRFERMTPGPVPPPVEVSADRPLAAAAVAEPSEDSQGQGLVTYIQLPSPVKVRIRMPGTF